MASNEKPGRKWFEFHLSTCVIVMLVASLVLGANLQPATTIWSGTSFQRMPTHPYGGFSIGYGVFRSPGWPFAVLDTSPHLTTLAANTLFGLALVITTGILSEFLIRNKVRSRLSKPGLLAGLAISLIWFGANQVTYYTDGESLDASMGVNLGLSDSPVHVMQRPWLGRGWPFVAEVNMTDRASYIPFRLAGSEGYLANCTVLFLLLFWSAVFMHFFLRRPETTLKRNPEGFTITPSQEPNSR